MCTVVLRWEPGEPVRFLALRDELVGRDFDDPGTWWPEVPTAVGGRDRTAGGTWCASDLATGRTGLVLNRPERRTAAPGAPSRGVLPLAVLTHGEDWQQHVPVEGMASFLLVLASPDRLTTWRYDGDELLQADLPSGTTMLTSGGEEDGKAVRHLYAFTDGSFPDGWQELLRETSPTDDPAALVVRHERDGRVFATVFGQLAEVEAGRARLTWSRTPWGEGPWVSQEL